MYHKEKRRRKQHSSYNSDDNVYQLSREDQVIMVRLRTGHCRLRHNLHTKLYIGDTDTCSCGMAPMTVEHLLQDFSTHQNESYLAYRNNSKRTNLWSIGRSAVHSDLRTRNRSPCLSLWSSLALTVLPRMRLKSQSNRIHGTLFT